MPNPLAKRSPSVGQCKNDYVRLSAAYALYNHGADGAAAEILRAIAYALPALGAAIGVGLIGKGALGAAGRNPEKIGDLRTLMITAIVFADSLAIIGIIVGFLAKG